MLVHKPAAETQSPIMLAKWFAARQDIPVVAGMILFFALFGARARAIGNGVKSVLGTRQAVALLAGFALIAWALRTLVLFDFDLSRDEKLVAFDIAIFTDGRLFAPIASFWRDSYEALNTLYTLPVGNREGWVSGYLPVNAALRALLGHALPAAAASPVQLLVAGLALWRIALRLWPDSASTRTAVLLLFAGSSQVLLMATTAYAMTTHLAFNLVWLWLFLQRRPLADGAALATGFLATGIHQPLFHPLFAGPFLLWLLAERQWRRLAVYALGYGAIGLFWLGWPAWMSAQGLHPVPAELDVAGVSFFDRLLRGAMPLTPNSLWLMGANLLRFFAWQHLLLLPLVIAALRLRQDRDPVCRALLLGIAGLIAVMTLILPMQVHGWGYRYLHGFIGSAVLVAGYGWHRLERSVLAPHRALRWATALSLLLVLPLHVWMARSIIAPYAAASAWLERAPAGIVIVDDGAAAFSLDLVLNRADLSNRPILLSASRLRPGSLPALCRTHTIAFADSDRLAPLDRVFGQLAAAGPSPRQSRLHDEAVRAGCRIVAIQEPVAPAASGPS